MCGPTQKRHVKEKRGSVAIEGFGEEEDVIKPVVSEDQKPKIKQVGKIDLDSLNSSKKAKVEPAQPKEEEPAPVEKEKEEIIEQEPVKLEQPKEEEPIEEVRKEDVEVFAPQLEVDVKDSDKEEDNVIRLSKELKTNINVIGKIDLSTINQQTRPKKKSKEERKKGSG